MNGNKIVWGFGLLLVLTTLTVTIGTSDSRSQENVNTGPTPPNSSFQEEVKKYALADYDAALPDNPQIREERRRKSQRYDSQNLVMRNPGPNRSGVERYDEVPPPPVFPVSESTFIVTGKIERADAFLSNDKLGVYTEFTIRIHEMLKKPFSSKLGVGDTIIADRAGGAVRYSTGQQLLYRYAERDLPLLDSSVILFLTCGTQSPNCEILTGYEVSDQKVSPLDFRDSRLDEFQEVTKASFVESIRNKIVIISQTGK
ncbi:MAG: hypothetical protein ACKVRN_03950 [Pyrinomonadaceae bacterium]